MPGWRLTLALVYRPVQQLEFRWDNEYRRQQENPLRNSGDKAFNTSLSLHWQPVFARHTRVSLVADNLTDSDFEEFPGTPAIGRQVSLGLGWDW